MAMRADGEQSLPLTGTGSLRFARGRLGPARLEWVYWGFLIWRYRTPGEAQRLHSRNVEDGLELLDQSPLLHGNLGSVELLEGVDTGTRDVRDQLVLLLEVTAVHGLVRALDLDGNGGLSSLADWDGLVIALDGCTVKMDCVRN